MQTDSGNAGNFFRTRPQSSFTNRRLTRQRKLRHVTDDELGLSTVDRPHAYTSPLDSFWKSRSATGPGLSSSPVPKLLPLPDYLTEPSAGHCLGSPEETPGSALGRKTPTLRASAKLSRLRIPVRSSPAGGFPSLDVSPPRSNGANLFPSHYLNVESASYNFRVDVSPRSAPSVFSSPAVSPLRSKTGDIFSSFWAPREIRFWSAGNTSSLSPVAVKGHRSPLHSLTVQSPEITLRRDSKFSFSLHPKPHPQNSNEWLESSHLNAHPLPLPPRVSPPQSSIPFAVVNHNTEIPSGSLKGQWQKGKLIGRGTFGSVYIATNRVTGASCAMKEVDIIPDDPKSAECIKQLEQEIRVLSQLQHQNIVQYYGSEVIDDHFYIYLEYVHPGSINRYVHEHCGGITESIVRNFTRHILSGLAYLHSKMTIHRDIKGANLLVDANGVVKLADFGMAKHLTGLSYELSMKGSPYWMAPELIQKDGKPYLALAVDIWSLGCSVIEMLTGKPPWSELEGPQAMFKVLHENPAIPETLSSEGKEFLQCCFRRNPVHRPSAMKLLEHPFVRNLNDQNVPMQGFSRLITN